MYDELLKKANEGDAEAMYQVGCAYQFAKIGDTPDFELAYYWYEKAAKKNHQEAMISLGDALTLGRGCKKDPDTGSAWYQDAYELGKLHAVRK